MWMSTTARLHPFSIWCLPPKRCHPPCCCRPWMIPGFLPRLPWIWQRRCLRRLRFAPCSPHGEATTASMAVTAAGATSLRRPGSGTLLLVKPRFLRLQAYRSSVIEGSIAWVLMHSTTAACGNPPQRFVDRCGVVAHQLREPLPEQLISTPGVVMRNR